MARLFSLSQEVTRMEIFHGNSAGRNPFPASAVLSYLLVALLAGLIGFGLGRGLAPPTTDPPTDATLVRQVATALDGHEAIAGQYAAFYELLADRLEAEAFPTTQHAGEVAERAARLLKLPGVLEALVNDSLNPHLGSPGPLTTDQARAAARELRALANACRAASP